MKDKAKLKSREELLDIMNEHLVAQQKFAEKLKNKAEKYIEDDSKDKMDIKARNSYIHAYNNQVDAVSRTSKMMISIYNSTFENGEEEAEDSLVD